MPQASVSSTPRSTDRGLALLRAVADHAADHDGEGIALADVARAAELSASTALRQLRAVEAAGFVARRADGRYVPGVELLRIARALAAGATLPRLAEPLLAQLANDTGESAYLAQPDGSHHAVYIAMAAGHHAVRHVSWLGNRLPRKGTAVGAALAGKADPDGVAVRVDAVEAGITAVSTPVHDAAGRVIAAISVVGPTYRQSGTVLAHTREAVARSGLSMSTALGARA